jgi:Fungalysin/Thermolysin Propeptide Motif
MNTYLAMKKLPILLILVWLSSCEVSNFCTDIIKGKPDYILINESDYNTVKSLFSTNDMSLDNYFVYRLQKDDLGYNHVRCYQYVNNLQVFSDEVIFHFNSQNQYNFLSGEIISEINISPDPKMSKNEAVKLFLELVDDDGFYTSKSLKDDCFLCEIGYYDLNAGSGDSAHNFKLAWKIHQEDSDIPFAYINDTDKRKIYYDNGVRY